MRCAISLSLLLGLSLLPCTAHGDTLDGFSVLSAGLDIEFSVEASVTLPDSLISNQYIASAVPGTLNGVPSTVGAHLIFPGPCSVCDTLFLTVTPVDPNAGPASTYEFGLPDLYTLTFPTPDSVTLTYIPGSYPSVYLIHPYYDVAPATILVTEQTTTTTPEPPSLTLVALAALVSLGIARRRSGKASCSTP